MMNKTIWTGLMCLGLAGIVAAPAPVQASPEISVFGVGNLASASFSDEDFTDLDSRELGIAAGLGVEFPVGNHLGLEIDGIYLKRKLGSSDDLSASFSYIQVPVLLRFWFSPSLSIGAGGYYAFGRGDNFESDVAFNTIVNDTDYGLVGVVGLSFPMAKNFSVMAEGRYSHGLKDILTVGEDAGNWNDIQFLAGLRFDLDG